MSKLTSYIVGFALSLAFTLLAVGGILVHEQTQHQFPTHPELRLLFVVLAVAQLAVQLGFFLHVGRGQNKHWNAVVLGFALFIITIVVGGTLWIMNNLQQKMVNNTFLNNQINVTQEND